MEATLKLIKKTLTTKWRPVDIIGGTPSPDSPNPALATERHPVGRANPYQPQSAWPQS
jgi:hypothetical protein